MDLPDPDFEIRRRALPDGFLSTPRAGVGTFDGTPGVGTPGVGTHMDAGDGGVRRVFPLQRAPVVTPGGADEPAFRA